MPLLRSELFRLQRRWMTRILLLVVVFGVAGVYATCGRRTRRKVGRKRSTSGGTCG